MAIEIDLERLVMTGVLIAAVILWGGIAIEHFEVYPAGTATAVTALGVFITAFAVVLVAIDILSDRSKRKPGR